MKVLCAFQIVSKYAKLCYPGRLIKIDQLPSCCFISRDRFSLFCLTRLSNVANLVVGHAINMKA